IAALTERKLAEGDEASDMDATTPRKGRTGAATGNLPAGKLPSGPPPVPPSRPRTGQVPAATAMPRRDGVPLGAVADIDRTSENRGAVGSDSDSLTTNAASGTIGGDTPPPVFDRAVIAAGQKGAVVSGRGTGPAALAQGTPQPSARPEAL